MSVHVVPPSVYYRVFAALMVLLALTVAAGFVELGAFNLALALVIATVKAALVLLFFMHVRYSSRLTWIFAVAGLAWLIILLGMTFSDYLTRYWLQL